VSTEHWPDTTDALDLVLGKLDGVRRQGGYWMARCPVPAHDDHRASLSVSKGTSQPVIFFCHAGCLRDDILDALGLTLAEIAAPRPKEDAEWTPRGPAVAVYDYRDEKGVLLFQVCRTAGKDFPQRVPDPLAPSGWRWRLGDTRRVLYRLPQLLEAIEAGRDVWICEGEKDADALAARGRAATCNPGGAGKWLPEYAETFRDVPVTIIADRDQPGRAHARAVAAALSGVAAAVDICEPKAGKDISDHLAAGLGLDDLLVTRPSDPAEAELVRPLTVFLAGKEEPQVWVIPDVLERADRLILTGYEGLGKSTLARQLAVGAAAGMHPFTGRIIDRARVLYVDCENAERKSRRRFRPLVATMEHMQRPVPREGFLICHMPTGIDLTKDEWRSFLLEQVTAHRPDLLVCGPLYKLHAVDANEETSARAITAVLDEAVAIADCALITEAHCIKGGGGARRPLEPAGSRLFLSWPDLGYGIRPANGSRRRVAVRSWRGDREERHWPTELIWGRQWSDWPWAVPTDEAPPDEPLPDSPADEEPEQLALEET
jgi:AAA domain